MKINVGCGSALLADHVNLDLRADCGADVVADARTLPYEDGSVEQITAFDFLEHHPADQTAALLGEWHRVLAPRGLLRLRLPNLHALAVQIGYWADQPRSPHLAGFIENVYGGHRWGPDGAWDTHHTGFTPASLALALQQAGFEVLSNDLEINMTVEATKP